MDLFDTHCHLDVTEFDTDRDAVLERTRAAGVRRMVVPAIHAAGWTDLVALCRREEGLFPALGMHPIYIEQHRDEHVDELRRRIERERPVAIGEIGLDFYIEETDRNRQQAIFEAQLAVAQDYQLPVLLHVRKAHDQVLQTLKRFKLPGGIAHAFNGSLPQAEQYLALGFKFGFGGMLTFERSNKLRRLASELPLESMVLETDAPDMTPASHQGHRNSPEYLPEVATTLAVLREMPVEEVASITTQNAMRLFGITA